MGAIKGQAVLIVDDFHCQLMRHALTRRGFAVFHATSPDEALALFEAHRAQIALVVIDLMKPAAGNLDLASDLERQRPGLPVLYLAGARKTIARCSIEAQSPGSVLAVPFTAEQFLGRVDGLLDLEAAAPQMPDEQLWERLLADSDGISSATSMLYVYEFGQSALAAGHVTMLRAAQIRHAFRPTNFAAAPYSVIVRAGDVARARGLIAQVCATRRLDSAA
jgi:DNA-binding NtrC family response regulator